MDLPQAGPWCGVHLLPKSQRFPLRKRVKTAGEDGRSPCWRDRGVLLIHSAMVPSGKTNGPQDGHKYALASTKGSQPWNRSHSLFSRSPKSHRSTASLSKRQLRPIRIAGIFPFAACLLIVISWSFKYFANSFVVNISPIKNSVFAYSLKKLVESFRLITDFLSSSSAIHEAQSHLYPVG